VQQHNKLMNSTIQQHSAVNIAAYSQCIDAYSAHIHTLPIHETCSTTNTLHFCITHRVPLSSQYKKDPNAPRNRSKLWNCQKTLLAVTKCRRSK